MPMKSIPSSTRKNGVGTNAPKKESLVGFIELHPDIAIAGGIVLAVIVAAWAFSRNVKTPATTNPTTPGFLQSSDTVPMPNYSPTSPSSLSPNVITPTSSSFFSKNNRANT